MATLVVEALWKVGGKSQIVQSQTSKHSVKWCKHELGVIKINCDTAVTVQMVAIAIVARDGFFVWG